LNDVQTLRKSTPKLPILSIPCHSEHFYSNEIHAEELWWYQRESKNPTYSMT
jgi:hypothetical protein